MRLVPHTLLFRTAVTIASALLLFMLITLGAAIYFVAVPIAKRSADDLAALMVLAATTWNEALPQERAALRERLMQDHGLVVAARSPSLPEQKMDYPYFLFLRDALTRRTGEEISILRNPGGHRLWVDMPVTGSTVRLGIERTRLSANPPLVLVLVIAAGALLMLLASFAVVRRVVGPLHRLAIAAEEVGKGGNPPPLAEDGPEELATLARTFNRMSAEVRELLDNRTVIVAGISHDLRTPLTRLGLAIEMLSDNEDPDLIAGIRRDLAVMESLIRQFLELAQELTDECQQEFDLWTLLVDQVEDLRRNGYDVELEPGAPCPWLGDPTAATRILSNLLDNAAHYGEGKPICVELDCDQQNTCIRISDRGPGIPEAQRETVFRPFHRLDTAREERTGGSGLGLAIAQQLASKNRWEIALDHRSGGGTVATFTLGPRGKIDTL